MKPTRPVEALVCVAAGLLFYSLLGYSLADQAANHDFLVFYTEGTITAEGNASRMYDIAFVQEVQKRIAPEAKSFVPPTRPAYFGVLMAPLGRLRLWPAFLVWIAAQLAALALFAWWARGRFGWASLAAMAFFVPFGLGIMIGQDSMFVVLLFLGAWLALERKRDGLAGALLAGALFKFHLQLLVAPAMLVQRKWRMLGAWAAVASFEAGVSIWIAGARPYVEMLTSGKLDTLSESPEVMPNVYAMLMNFGLDVAILRVLLVAAVAAVALLPKPAAWQALPQHWFWSAAAGSILITPHAYSHDVAILLPAFLCLVQPGTPKAARIVAMVAMTIVPYIIPMFGEPWSAMPSLVMLAVLAAFTGRLPEAAPAGQQLADSPAAS
jgi:hypothetical protein